jgi:predicted DNA-binding WGR domain protein
MAKRRFEFVGGGSSKFWEIELDGRSLVTRWGKIGTAGQSQGKRFFDAAMATKEADKLVAEKTKKGYVEGEAKPAPKSLKQELAELDGKLGKRKLPYAELVEKKTKKPIPLWASKGCDGRPYLPKDQKWPGEYLLPVVQIDFADVPKLPGFPTSGLLSLWWTDDHQQTKLFYYPKIIKDESKLWTDFSRISESTLYPYRAPTILTFAKGEGIAPYGDYRFKEIMGEEYCDAFWDSPNQSQLWNYIWKQSGNGNSRIGGYASPQQSDPRENKKNRKYEAQLLQLENDNFTHNFFMTPAALKRRDFSDVLEYNACD